MNFHVEVHSRDRQVEHYICQDCETEGDAVQAVIQFYFEKGYRLGQWSDQDEREDFNIPYLIFRVRELEKKPVIHIAGEYRPAYPL